MSFIAVNVAVLIIVLKIVWSYLNVNFHINFTIKPLEPFKILHACYLIYAISRDCFYPECLVIDASSMRPELHTMHLMRSLIKSSSNFQHVQEPA